MRLAAYKSARLWWSLSTREGWGRVVEWRGRCFRSLLGRGLGRGLGHGAEAWRRGLVRMQSPWLETGREVRGGHPSRRLLAQAPQDDVVRDEGFFRSANTHNVILRRAVRTVSKDRPLAPLAHAPNRFRLGRPCASRSLAEQRGSRFRVWGRPWPVCTLACPNRCQHDHRSEKLRGFERLAQP